MTDYPSHLGNYVTADISAFCLSAGHGPGLSVHPVCTCVVGALARELGHSDRQGIPCPQVWGNGACVNSRASAILRRGRHGRGALSAARRYL